MHPVIIGRGGNSVAGSGRAQVGRARARVVRRSVGAGKRIFGVSILGTRDGGEVWREGCCGLYL